MPQPDESVVLKAVGALEIKSADEGTVEAVIATLEVVDRDSEVIRKNAIPDGAKVKLSAYGHDAVFGELPVGKGAIHIEGEQAVFRGKFFLQTPRGAEAFQVVKAMGTDQEWSFGFRVLGAEVPDEAWREKGARRILTKLDAFEVSPVIRGAGIDTHTVAVKDAQAAADEEARQSAELAAKAAADAKAAQDAAEAATKAAELARTRDADQKDIDLRKQRTTGKR